ncbi:CHAT domain-containing protein [uncultured Dokdonia sp.]|uniref:CHAT domain-containing protein n=1 Tax=uncultured Dokdonia sp. TaxID=575653 RepID=UPI002604072E|nr:CHAT domain-containing protein [uncultured Dokdonia sp.]
MFKKVFFAIFSLLFIGNLQAQETSFYKVLDQFLEVPTQDNFSQLITASDSLQTPNLKSHLAKVVVDCNIAYYQERQGTLHKAIARYENAIDRYSQYQLEGYDIVTYAMIPLGNLYTKTNAYTEAENLIKGYITLSRKQNNSQDLLSGLINLSIPLQNQGKYTQAIRILEEAYVLAPKNKDIQMNLATNYLSVGNYQKAENKAKQLIKKDPNQINAYKLLSQIALQKGNTTQAIQLLETTIEIQTKLPNQTLRDITKSKLALAQACIIQQDYEAAITQLEYIYRTWHPNHPSGKTPNKTNLIAENTLMDALDLHAEIHKQKDRKEKALEAYEGAAEVSDLLNSPQLSQQSRLVLEASDKRRSEERISLLYELYQDQKDVTFLEKAIQISDRSKASLVSEAMNDKAKLSQYAQDNLVIEYEQRTQKLAQLEVQLLQKQQSTDIKGLEELQSVYSSELLLQKKLREAISKKHPDLKPSKATFTLQDIQTKATQSQQTIISYFFGLQTVYQFVISPNEIRFHQIAVDRKALDQLFNSCIVYNRYFENASTILNDPSGFSKQSFNVFKALHIIPSTQMVIIPDGILAFVPFNTLLTSASTQRTFSEMPFLLKETQTTFQRSYKEYLKPNLGLQDATTVLGVFPVFENTSLALEHSKEEAKAIQETFNTELLMSNKASVNNTFTKASQHTILHFSTHASGGSFTEPASIAFIDRSLYLNELYSKNLNPDLVVLSACETGIGRIASGEGPLSLARGFQYAGAKSVLFSLWKVNDQSTANLMSRYYITLKETVSRNASLQISQRAYLQDENISNSKKSPYYWGAFVYYGPTDIPSQQNHPLWWWILGIFGVLLSIVLIRKYGKS